MSTENNDESINSNGGYSMPLNPELLDPETRKVCMLNLIILQIYPVLMLVLGSFGNLLSFCVLLRATMRRYSTFCYLACLALVDLGVIITFCVNFISLYHFQYDIQNEPFPCKLFAFSIYFLPQYSSWILVAVSIDRVISAKYIRLAKTWSKPKHSVLVTFVLGIFLAVLNSHFFLYENNSNDGQYNQTNIQNEQQEYRMAINNTILERMKTSDAYTQQNYFLLANTFSSSIDVTRASDSPIVYEPFTPPSIQFINQDTTMEIQTDSESILKLKEMPCYDVNMLYCSLENSKKFKRYYVYWAWIDLAMNVFVPFTAMIACTIIIILTLVRSSTRAGSTSARRSRRRRNISVMLITVNLVFISLTAPIVIFLSVSGDGQNTTDYQRSLKTLVKIFCIILMNLNHSINIVIYSVTAKEFRLAMTNFLQSLLYCIIGRPVNPSDLAYIHDERGLLSRLRHVRQTFFECCRLKLHSNSTNTTDSSGFQHTTAPGAANHNRTPNSNQLHKRKRFERNGSQKHVNQRMSEISLHKNNYHLTVQLQPDPASSFVDREDVSFHGLSISTED